MHSSGYRNEFTDSTLKKFVQFKKSISEKYTNLYAVLVFNIVSDIEFAKYPFTEFHIKPHPSDNTDQYSNLKKFKNV